MNKNLQLLAHEKIALIEKIEHMQKCRYGRLKILNKYCESDDKQAAGLAKFFLSKEKEIILREAWRLNQLKQTLNN